MEKITGEMLPPDAPVTELKNVGPKRAALYQKLGIETVSDLLTFYPRGYQDFTSPKMAAECRDGEPAVIEGKSSGSSPRPISAGGWSFIN